MIGAMSDTEEDGQWIFQSLLGRLAMRLVCSNKFFRTRQGREHSSLENLSSLSHLDINIRVVVSYQSQ